MSSAEYCIEKAQMCESRAQDCADTRLAAQWLEMAAYWRALAGDDSDQATTARMMGKAGKIERVD